MNDPFQLSRREDREVALALLYEVDMTGDGFAEVVDRNRADDEDYSTQIAVGVAEHLTELDSRLDEVAEDWSVARMAGIDRSILRLGLWELLYSPEVPTTAVVSEAVALANEYSTERSAPFINGILVKLGSLHRSE